MESERRPTTIDDLTLIKTPSDPQISPDGTRIAYVVKTVDVEKNRYNSHIHVVPTDPATGASKQWTHSTESESHPRWSPDGRWLAFQSGREEKKGQLFLLPIEGGEAERVSDLGEGGIGDFAWSPDGARIAFTFRPSDEDRGEKAEKKRKDECRSAPPREITRRHYREDGSGFRPTAPYDLYVLETATRATTRLTHGDVGDQGSFAWSPDSSRIAVVRNTASDPDLAPNATEIFVLPAAGLEEGVSPERVIAPVGPKESISWSPDGALIAYLGHDDPNEIWGVRNLHVWVAPLDPAGPPARDLMDGWDVTCGNHAIGDMAGGGESGPFWLLDSRTLLVQISERGSVALYRVAIESETPPQALTAGAQTVSGFTMNSAGTSAALVVATPADAGDIYSLAVRTTTAAPVRLTEVNGGVFQTIELAQPITFEAPTAEGKTVGAWVLLPPGHTAGPQPTVLYIHGGPHLMYAHNLFHEYQALAAAGYVVIYPNPRGSTGYGEAWTGAIRGNWGAPAHDDCLACLDYALAQGWTDPARVGVAGGSYGGYLTAWMVGHTDRFAAAVAERGVFNLHSMAGTCDFVWRDRDYFDADTAGDPADYLRNSPLTYADSIHAPLLIVHSEGDLRCPIEQAEQLFAALKLRGRETVFLRYGPEASHGLSRSGPPDLRLDRQRRIHAWFDRYLKV